MSDTGTHLKGRPDAMLTSGKYRNWTRCTPELTAAYCAALRTATTFGDARRAVNIDEANVAVWLRKGERVLREQPAAADSDPFAQFCIAVTAAVTSRPWMRANAQAWTLWRARALLVDAWRRQRAGIHGEVVDADLAYGGA